MTEKLKLLLLDDEVEILNSLKRVLRKKFDVSSFNEPEQAIRALKQDNYAIIISDMKMPVMDGATFLATAKALAPDSVRILLTGYSDMDSTAKAINEGNIFSYCSKPWNNEELKQLLGNAAEHYLLKQKNDLLTSKLKQANEQLVEFNANLERKVKQRSQALIESNNRLKQSIEKHRNMFQQLLDMVALIIEDRTKDRLGHNKRVALHSKLLAEQLGWDRAKVINTYIAALVHDLGKVALPDDLLEQPEHELDQQQRMKFREHAQAGADILEQLPQLEPIAVIVRAQFSNVTNNTAEQDVCPEESRLVHLVADFDALLIGLKTGYNMSPEEAMAFLTDNTDYLYDEFLLKEYQNLLTELPNLKLNELDYCLATEQLEQGMSIAEDIVNKNGAVMLAKDAILTTGIIDKLKHYEEETGFKLSVYVY